MASRIDKTGFRSDEQRFVVHDLLLDKLNDNVSPWPLLVASLTIAQRSLHDSAGQRCVRSDNTCGVRRGIIAESTTSILRTNARLAPRCSQHQRYTQQNSFMKPHS